MNLAIASAAVGSLLFALLVNTNIHGMAQILPHPDGQLQGLSPVAGWRWVETSLAGAFFPSRMDRSVDLERPQASPLVTVPAALVRNRGRDPAAAPATNAGVPRRVERAAVGAPRPPGADAHPRCVS